MRHDYEKFLALVEYGSFSAAARAIHVSQPALTTAIKQLESQYKQSLIERGTKPLKLTEAGALLYESALRMRGEVNALEGQLSQLGSGKSPRIRLGAIDSVAISLIGEIDVPEFLSIHVDNSARLVRRVLERTLDVAIVTEQRVTLNEQLKQMQIGTEQFKLIVHPSIKSEVAKQLSASSTIESFVTYNPESTTYQHIMAHAKQQNIKLRPYFVSTNPEVIKQMVLQRHGAALLPWSLVSHDLSTGELAEIDSDLSRFKRPISAIYHSQLNLTKQHTSLFLTVKKLLSQT